MKPVTGVTILSVKASKQPNTIDESVYNTLQQTISSTLEQKGAQRCYWGSSSIEHPDRIYLFVDWDAVEFYHDFTNKGEYKTVMHELTQSLNGDPVVYHLSFSPHPPQRTLSRAHSPVTEIVTVYFPTEFPPESQDSFATDMLTLQKILETGSGGCNATAAGWAVEHVDVPGKTEKGKAFVLAIGWDSVEAHKLFTQSDALFKEHVFLIQKAVGQLCREMCHASLEEVCTTE